MLSSDKAINSVHIVAVKIAQEMTASTTKKISEASLDRAKQS